MYRESGKMFDPNSKKEASSKPQNALTDYRAKGTVTSLKASMLVKHSEIEVWSIYSH